MSYKNEELLILGSPQVFWWARVAHLIQFTSGVLVGPVLLILFGSSPVFWWGTCCSSYSFSVLCFFSSFCALWDKCCQCLWEIVCTQCDMIIYVLINSWLPPSVFPNVYLTQKRKWHWPKSRLTSYTSLVLFCIALRTSTFPAGIHFTLHTCAV
jgi:hypothetical protein